MDSEKKLSMFLQKQREEHKYHKQYQQERQFYHLIQEGNWEEIKKYTTLHVSTATEGFGTLSKKPIHHLKYHFVALATMLTRYCIEGGMPEETAYSLSDLYIQEVDTYSSIPAIQSLHKSMIYDYTSRMQRLHQRKSYTIHVKHAIEYIDKHLHERIRIEELAHAIPINPSYLSKIFKQETGLAISEYINIQKTTEISNILKFSAISYSEIALQYGFSSQSHFIQVFAKYKGMTPKQFRSQYHAHAIEE